MVNNEIYLRRKNRIWIEKKDCNEVTAAHIGAILKNLEPLGYCLSKELIEILFTLSISQLKAVSKELIRNLKKMLGAHVKYRPMYPNFPKQVMELSEAELYLNAVLHYLSSGKILPAFQQQIRTPEQLPDKFQWIGLGTEDEFQQIMAELLMAKASISSTDQEDLRWFLFHCPDLKTWLPQELFLHETKAFVCGVILERMNLAKSEEQEREKELAEELLLRYLTTATDVLRLAAVSSGGDVSLAEPVRFRKWNRRERRMLLLVLDHCRNLTEDMKRYRERWLRLGEQLHPGEYPRYTKAAKAFYCLRNDKHISTYAGTTEKYFQTGELQPLLKHLSYRPGEFARKLDRLLRTFPDTDMILDSFLQAAEKLSTPLLLQLRTHFLHRAYPQTEKPWRVFFPKGNLAKAYLKEEPLPPLSQECCKTAVSRIEETLLRLYAKRTPMGNVYVAPEFEDYLVPFSQRSASKALHTITRGSKLSISQNSSVLRVFLYWKDGDERTDIDLSAVVLSKEWEWLDHISYTNLKSTKIGACHSGDIVAAPNGASEFIDIDFISAWKTNARYIVFTVNSFTCQPYCELPECFMGYMERPGGSISEAPGQQGPIYDPRTVRNKIDLTANTRICVPMLLDLWTWKLIWMDLALKKMPGFNCVENNANSIISACKAFTVIERPSLMELLKLNIQARGTAVEEKEKAELCFDLETGITPFDTERFLAEYL